MIAGLSFCPAPRPAAGLIMRQTRIGAGFQTPDLKITTQVLWQSLVNTHRLLDAIAHIRQVSQVQDYALYFPAIVFRQALQGMG